MSSLLLRLLLFVAFIRMPDCAPALPAVVQERPVLARVELAGPPESFSLPTHAFLQDGAGRDYLLVFATEEELREAGWPWRILARGVSPPECLLATEFRPGARQYGLSRFEVLYDDGARLLLRAKDGDATALAEAGFALQRFTSEPIIWPKRGALVAKDLSTAKQLPDPMVSAMLASVQTTNLYSLLGRLSGGQPLLARGAPRRVPTRHTSSGDPLTNALDFAFQRFAAIGLMPWFHLWNNGALANRNLVVEIPGTSRSNEIVLVTAHLDDMPSTGTAPGADDNGSGAAAVTAAVGICSQFSFERTLRFVLFTGEEQGLFGSSAYAALVAQRNDNIIGVLNLDMLGWNSKGQPAFEVHTRSTANPGYPGDLAIFSTFTNVVAVYGLSGDLLPVLRADALSASDHSAFWNRGYAAVLAIEDLTGDLNPYYHSANDTIQHIDFRYYTAAVRACTGTAAHLAGPVGRIPSDVVEVDNSNWDPAAGVGVFAFVARHLPFALEQGTDSLDLSASAAPANPFPRFLEAVSDPFGVPLLHDSRPPASETTFASSLVLSAPPGTYVSGSNSLRFEFVAPPAPDRIYLARIRTGAEYVPGGSEFLCVTNLRGVAAEGGYVSLPGLLSMPAATYGTCEISCRFLDTSSAACPLRVVSAAGSNLVLATEAQVGTTVCDEIQYSPTLSLPLWTPLASFTNDVTVDATSFDVGTKELLRPLQLPSGSSPATFFRLKRTWLAP